MRCLLDSKNIHLSWEATRFSVHWIFMDDLLCALLRTMTLVGSRIGKKSLSLSLCNGQIIMGGGLLGGVENILLLWGQENIIWSRQPKWRQKNQTGFIRLKGLCVPHSWKISNCSWLAIYCKYCKVVLGKQMWNERVWATLSSGRRHFILVREDSIGHLE